MSVAERLPFEKWINRFAALIQRWFPVAYEPSRKWPAQDFIAACALGAIAVVITIYTTGQLDSRLYCDPAGYNVWFEADTPRALGAMDNALPKYHRRNEVHPIFSLLTIPLLAALKGLGASALRAALGLIAACAFLTTALLFLTLRGLGLPLLVATLFTAAFLSSASFLHWFAIAETAAFAALSISAALFVLTRVSATNWWAWTLASAFALAITVTNWSVALASAIVRLDFRRAIYTSLAALLLVAGLASVQALTVPGSGLFYLPGSVIYEYRHTQIRNNIWSPAANAWSTVVTSAVAPAPYQDIHLGPGRAPTAIVDNQQTSASSYGPLSMVAIASWIVMLGCGIRGGMETPRLHAVFFAVSLFLASQVCLYLVYGNLTFLYATNYFPAMIALAALGWFSSRRVLAMGAAVLFVFAGAWSNLAQFRAAAAIAQSILSGT